MVKSEVLGLFAKLTGKVLNEYGHEIENQPEVVDDMVNAILNTYATWLTLNTPLDSASAVDICEQAAEVIYERRKIQREGLIKGLHKALKETGHDDTDYRTGEGKNPAEDAETKH